MKTPVPVGGESIKKVESFVYLESVVDRQVGNDQGVKAPTRQARVTFVMLKNIWASKKIRMTAKLRIFNSCVAVRS